MMRQAPVRQFLGQPAESFDRVMHVPSVTGAVDAHALGGFRHRAQHESRSSIRQRMSKRDFGFNPRQAKLLKRQTAKEWRERRERMHGRAAIVQEPRQRQLLGARRAARRWLGLKH